MTYDVIVIGGGAAGLMCAHKLSQSGQKVCILEASKHFGGRIETLTEQGFDMPVETGAEFIHGRSPITLSLLKQAGINYTTVQGEMVNVKNGVWLKEDTVIHDFELMIRKLDELETDTTIKSFLDQHFPVNEYDEVREIVTQFSEGFSLADINTASVFAFREDWEKQQEDNYRITGGYQQLINYLVEECNANGAVMQRHTVVQKVDLSNGTVAVHSSKEFRASKVIVTVPVSVLQSRQIRFIAPVDQLLPNIDRLSFGSVIKVLIQFRLPFWQQIQDDLGFILSNEAIPTWWTQLPNEIPLLTGWVGGPAAAKLGKLTDTEIYRTALRSLSNIFKIDLDSLSNQVKQCKVVNWNNKPYIKGGYSYTTLESEKAKRKLSSPFHDMIFFAGESLPMGGSQGTVEAALESALNLEKQVPTT